MYQNAATSIPVCFFNFFAYIANFYFSQTNVMYYNIIDNLFQPAAGGKFWPFTVQTSISHLGNVISLKEIFEHIKFLRSCIYQLFQTVSKSQRHIAKSCYTYSKKNTLYPSTPHSFLSYAVEVWGKVGGGIRSPKNEFRTRQGFEKTLERFLSLTLGKLECYGIQQLYRFWNLGSQPLLETAPRGRPGARRRPAH